MYAKKLLVLTVPVFMGFSLPKHQFKRRNGLFPLENNPEDPPGICEITHILRFQVEKKGYK